ncbi:MAG: hypothetical protein A3C90_04025 [Candidatus Magasanikbacteria bacterium RIFCSPHIGHO2_02_FULL_51_14]|uniref:Uncharacterized protein n=1 Tax=Candidatus Magasanikbacteria bacterium RIFCSPHIGHO2_02_FULL_51_14 TaxID=1798683 RepID=A0A1F6ME19_9BACT|nr:MAG: hypothetical protein A3C90_04025 [Candidatus Magasanikbacteria bacterium RIFCSPHIGHO2_02_FULL_51_14]
MNDSTSNAQPDKHKERRPKAPLIATVANIVALLAIIILTTIVVAVGSAPNPGHQFTALGGGTAGSVLFFGSDTNVSEDGSNLFWDDTNNRFGIGTSTPSETLSVSGTLLTTGAIVPATNNAQDIGTATTSWRDLYASGTAFLGALQATGTIGFATTTGASTLLRIGPDAADSDLNNVNIGFTRTDLSGGNVTAVNEVYTFNPSGDSSATVRGRRLRLITPEALDANLSGGMFGLIEASSVSLAAGKTLSFALGGQYAANAAASNAGTISDAVGIQGAAGLASASAGGTVVTGTAMWATINNTGTGSMTEGRGLYVPNPSGSATIGTLYGLKIDNLTDGTTDYGAYIGGADTYALWVDSGTTRLDGNVGIGITSPSQALEVNGGVRLNTADAKPTCDSDKRGTFWVTQGASGVKDNVEVCAKDASDAYAWRTIY